MSVKWGTAQLSSWKDIAGKRIILKNKYGNEEPDVMVYLNEHVPLELGEFEIKNNKRSLSLHISGKCDSMWGSELKLEAEIPINLKCIWFGKNSKALKIAHVVRWDNPPLALLGRVAP